MKGKVYRKYFFKALLIYLIPGALVSIGKFGLLFDWAVEKLWITEDGKELIMLVCFLVGLVIALVMHPAQKAAYQAKIDETNKAASELLKAAKLKFTDEFKSTLNLHKNHEISTRIFLPGKNNLKSWWLSQRHFQIFNIDALTNDRNSDGVKFKVAPSGQEEGLVGRSYQKKVILHDCDLNGQKVPEDDYRLTPTQKSLTDGDVFAICAPIFKPGTKDEIIAIISMDSKTQITFQDNSAYKDKTYAIMAQYCHVLKNYLPLIN